MKIFYSLMLLVLVATIAVFSINNNLALSNDRTLINATDSICFNKDIFPLFYSYCATSGCHDAVTKKKGVNVTSYTLIMRGIQAGNPNSSSYYTEMFDGMPPNGYPQMSAAQLNIIQNWILNGAKNDSCQTKNCDTTNITVSGTIQSIVKTYCIGCHFNNKGGGGINLSTDQFIKDNSIAIYGSVYHLNGFKPMPPIGLVDDCNKLKIKLWANAANSTPCDSSNVTYSKSIQPILQKYCVSCHNSTTTKAGLNFTIQAQVQTNIDRIHGAIFHLDGYSPMPPDSSIIVDPCSLALVRIFASKSGVQQYDNSSFSVRPNPSNGSFSFILPNTILPDFSIEIIDQTGSIVDIINSENCNSKSSDIRYSKELAQGLYFARLRSGNDVFYRKFLIIK
ncbi:MAG: T9SS type A sorting domain-containing protein [Candidatus Kapabacteria bacterium]|nr:T9SS type A sorting domain-containing protein [Candidatus Kapabacteria bacterium]